MDDYSYIDNYFKGMLPPEEMKRFDQQIQEDPAFAENMAFYCNAMQEIKKQAVEDKKQRFREMYKRESVQKEIWPARIFMQRWMRVAAAVVIVAAVAAWLLWQPDARKLADKYIQNNFYLLPNTMGAGDSLQAAIAYYNSNRLPEALAIFNQLAAKDSTNETAIKNAGIVSLRMKEYDKAITYFTRLEKMQRLHANPGKFYKALTLLERNLPGDTEMVKKLLKEVIENNLQNKEEAIEIFKKL